jgi:hypothetical protein
MQLDLHAYFSQDFRSPYNRKPRDDLKLPPSAVVGQTEPMLKMQRPKKKGKIAAFLAHPSSIDKISRVIFPVAFVTFNIGYWVAYYNISRVNFPKNFVEL